MLICTFDGNIIVVYLEIEKREKKMLEILSKEKGMFNIPIRRSIDTLKERKKTRQAD